jgi:hypothetical protein
VELVSALTDEELERRESPGAWNAREILAHLALTERSITMGINRTIAGGREAGAIGEPLDLSLEERVSQFDVPALAERLQAPPRVVPGDVPLAQSLEDLSESRKGLVAALESGDGLALDDLKFPHPAVGPVSIPSWVAFIGLHELRHLRQIKRTLESGNVS